MDVDPDKRMARMRLFVALAALLFAACAATETPLQVAARRLVLSGGEAPPEDLHADSDPEVSDRRGDSGIKGNAVVVGRVSDTLVCRFFPSAVGPGEAPAVGDTTWGDHATSRELRASWRSKDHP